MRGGCSTARSNDAAAIADRTAVNEPPLRYRAFLSYSHRDSAVTQKLHRRLETYPIPRMPRPPGSAALPRRLHPVFRDRDELASATELSHSIERALDESAALIVVCSPAAVQSPWVGAEIASFRRRHPERPVFAFVVDGDPGLDPRVDPGRAALPLNLLLRELDRPDGALSEPLAADARDEGDGFTSAFFKLVAGLLGLRYDDLRRRDQHRRQQRWAVASGVALLLAAVFAWLAWDATVARDAARRAQALAELELQSERQTREFLLSVFQLADADEARGQQVTVREVLDRAVDRIDRSHFDRAAIRARFLATMGQAYASLGLNARGSELLQRSIEGLAADVDAEAAQQRIESRIELAEVLFDMGRYDEALSQADAFDRDERNSSASQRARMWGIRGEVLTYLERDDEARAAFARALELLPPVAAAGEAVDVALARARGLYGMASIALFAGDPAAAQQGYQAALELLQRTVGEDHPRSIAAAISLGSAAYRNDQRELARRTWTAALGLAARVYDPDGPLLGTLSNNLGLLEFEDGRLDAAEPLLRAALASDRRHRSETFDDLAYPLHNLGYLLLTRGEFEQATPLLEEGLAIAEASGHRMQAALLIALTDLHCSRGATQTGLAYALRAVEVAAADPAAAEAWRAAQARLVHGWCRRLAGEAVDSDAFAADLATIEARWPPASPFRQRAQAQFAALRR